LSGNGGWPKGGHPHDEAHKSPEKVSGSDPDPARTVRLPETVLWRGVDATPPRLISRDGTAVLRSSNMGLCWNQVRIDPNATVAGHPALVIRRTLRRLRGRLSWGLADLEAAAALNPGEGHALAKALRAARLIEGAGRGAWVITQAGQTFSSATAAKPITRMTAERALAEFLERVRRVERDPYFLAKVTRVVLFGSMCLWQLFLAPFGTFIWPHLSH